MLVSSPLRDGCSPIPFPIFCGNLAAGCSRQPPKTTTFAAVSPDMADPDTPDTQYFPLVLGKILCACPRRICIKYFRTNLHGHRENAEILRFPRRRNALRTTEHGQRRRGIAPYSGLLSGILNGLRLGGGAGGIRTLDTLLTYTHFPGERLRPLGHRSAFPGSGRP